MMNFLYKHVLFPKKFGWQPYYYLIFMLPTLSGLASYSLFEKAWAVLLILVFLKAYRDGYTTTKYHPLSIGIQLAIGAFFALNPWVNTFGFQIFTGFEIGFSDITEHRFRQYLVAFYGSVIPSFVLSIWFYWHQFLASNMIWIFVGIGFAVLAPVFARTINKSYSLNETNKELEAKVRQLERERIAYDLHDNVGQAFSTITLQAELAKKLVDKDPNRAKEELDRIAQNSRDNLTLVREIVSDLHEESVKQVLAEETRAFQLAGIELSTEGPLDSLPDSLSSVLKEALANVIHHAQASKASVSLADNQLIISDNGRGLTDSKPSHGLIGMRRRVEALGADFSINSNKGTTITVRLKT